MRFGLQFPIETIRVGNEALALRGVTENVSSRGVLFNSPSPIAVGEIVEFSMDLSNGLGTGVNLRCAGSVLRSEIQDSGRCSVAATIERHAYLRS